MRNVAAPVILALLAFFGAPQGFASQASPCNFDKTCREFERLAEAEQYEKIIEKAGPAGNHSEGARRYIGRAYLALASREGTTPEQEEQYCRKALEYGFAQAYMGLYFLYAQKDAEAALGFLRQYVATRPKDSVPYVILGESELEKKEYKLADAYLREAKKVGRSYSAHLDWLLFQTNYLLGNYAYAGERLESALAQEKFRDEFKTLTSDPRFAGIEKRPEFKKHLEMLKDAKQRT